MIKERSPLIYSIFRFVTLYDMQIKFIWNKNGMYVHKIFSWEWYRCIVTCLWNKVWLISTCWFIMVFSNLIFCIFLSHISFQCHVSIVKTFITFLKLIIFIVNQTLKESITKGFTHSGHHHFLYWGTFDSRPTVDVLFVTKWTLVQFSFHRSDH